MEMIKWCNESGIFSLLGIILSIIGLVIGVSIKNQLSQNNMQKISNTTNSKINNNGNQY
jgi:hypothetical protein